MQNYLNMISFGILCLLCIHSWVLSWSFTKEVNKTEDLERTVCELVKELNEIKGKPRRSSMWENN